MASYVFLELDTTAPANPSILLEGGATYANAQLIDATISTSDGDTTGYQMKIWGDVDLTDDPNIQDTEVNSSWITYNTTKQVKLSTGDGSKTINLRIRDDVHNESAQTSDSIILDTTMPVVTVGTLDVDVISKIAGKDTASFDFTVDVEFVEYKVKVVGTTGASHDTGTTIPTTAGSINTSDTGTFPASTPITVTIKGADLETASAGDGQKIVKVFAKDDADNWSA